LISLNKNDFLL